MQRNRAFRQLCFWAICSLLSFSQALSAQDKTTSPYLVVISEDPETDRLPLKHTGAQVRIAGTIADVQVTQVYQNEGNRPLEAVYVFPASTRAAIYKMELTIGDKIIRAKIHEKNQARQIYEKAKDQGKTASLLEEHRPNVFQMNVANILPGDSLVVTFSYTELIVPEAAQYEFVYPTVVGPRYTGEGGGAFGDDFSQPEKWTAQGHTAAGKAPHYDFSFDLKLNSAIPISSLSSPSHSMQFKGVGTQQAHAELSADEVIGGNRDLILRYNLQGQQIQTGLLTYQKKGEKFFLLMAQPPKRIKRKEIPPREYIFIMDVSGSMSGFPLETSKQVMTQMINDLSPKDRFNIMLFAGGSSTLAKRPLRANVFNKGQAMGFIQSANGGGGTNLIAAMDDAYKNLKPSGYSQNIVILTDGYISAEAGAFDLIRSHYPDVNVWAFGIGSSVNRHLIEGMAEVGGGEPFVVTNAGEAEETAARFLEYIRYPVLTDISVDFGDARAYDVEPLRMRDLFAERPIVMQGKYKGKLKGQVTLKGITGFGDYEQIIPLASEEEDNQALRYLWARERIRRISDHLGRIVPDSVQKEVTQLGLDYTLVTPYTSFVAVFHKKRNKEGETESINQPLPLPQGVPNSALANVNGVRHLDVVTGGIPASYGTILYSSSSPSYTLSSVSITGNRNYTNLANCTQQSSSLQASQSINQLGLCLRGSSSGDLDGMPLAQGLAAHDAPGMIPEFWTWGRMQYLGSKPLNMGLPSGMDQGLYQLWSAQDKGLGVQLQGDQYGQMSLQARAGLRANQVFLGNLYVDLGYNPVETDRNEDGFRDIPQSNWLGFAGQFKVMPYLHLFGERRTLYTSSTVFYRDQQDEFGQVGETEVGQRRYDANRNMQSLSFRNSSSISLKGDRFISVGFAANLHRRTQNWGDRHYTGRQNSYFARATLGQYLWRNRLSLKAGFAYKNETFSEGLDQLQLARKESMPGAFLTANAFLPLDFQARGGLRADFHNLYGNFVTPNLDLSWSKNGTNIQAGLQRSFHVVNPITQNQLYLFSSRQFVLEDVLQAERSWDFRLSASQQIAFLKLSASYLHRQYSNRVLSNLDRNPDQLILQNSDQESHQKQLAVKVELPLTMHFSLEGTWLWNRSQSTYEGQLLQDPFVAEHSGSSSLIFRSHTFSKEKGWVVRAQVSYIGEQRIPDVGLPLSSSLLILPDLRIEHYFKWGRVYLLGENLSDQKQLNPILNADTPFAQGFDAGMLWGPVIGRRVSAGISFTLKKDK